MSPPWGGPQYIKDELYDADTSLASFGGLRGLMAAAMSAVRTSKPSPVSHVPPAARLNVDAGTSGVGPSAPSPTADVPPAAAGDSVADTPSTHALLQRRGLAMFLPRQTDLQQLSAAAPEGTMLEIERAVLDGFVKGITVYLWL